MINTKAVSHGAIIDFSSGKIYDSSEGFTVGKHSITVHDETGKEIKQEIDEVAVLTTMMKSKGSEVGKSGIWIGGVYYQLINFREDINTAYLKST